MQYRKPEHEAIETISFTITYHSVCSYFIWTNGRPLDLIEEEKLFLEFEPQGAFYQESQRVQLTSLNDASAKIYYTLDGDDPNSSAALLYKGPITVSKTTIIRAVAVKGADRTKIKGNTYFINEPETKLAVVSLGIPPSLLFDPDKGLFVKGDNYDDSHWSLPGKLLEQG